jgi:hypothetical protein
VRNSTAILNLLRKALDLTLHHLWRGVSRPDRSGASKLIQHYVALQGLRRFPFEHEHRPQSQARGGSCRQPRVVALRPTSRDDGRRTSGECLRAGVLQLANLVPPPPSPLRSSRSIQRLSAANPNARLRRGADSDGVGQLPSRIGARATSADTAEHYPFHHQAPDPDMLSMWAPSGSFLPRYVSMSGLELREE